MIRPLISVIIPIYNVAEYLSECLESILSQQEQRFEVIAVNDGSTDESRTILGRYADNDSRIRIVDQQNMGLAGARNAGVAHSSGRYICFVDSDDFVSDAYLSTMLGNAEKFGADVSICGRATYSGGVLSHQVRAGFTNRLLNSVEAVRALNSYRSFDMSMCGKLFASHIFEGIEFPVGKNSEDQFVCYKLLVRARRVYYVDVPLYFYRMREGSISRGAKVNTFPIEASNSQLAFMRENMPGLVYAAETSCFFSRVAVYNAFAVRRRSLPRDVATILQNEPMSYLRSVLTNPDISWTKKFQALVFCFARPLYRQIYILRRG